MSRLQRGDRAPSFTLETEQGQRSLADFKGQWVVLFFYPKNFTPGCTEEACDFRDVRPSLPENVAVLGVSPDPVDSHKKFREAYSLNFPLLADEDSRVAKAYGAYGVKKLGSKESEGILRSTFIIAPEGTVHEAMYDVKATGHALAVAEKVAEALKGSRS
jgi:thioredoxin-dependent peroxiredoxin